MERFATGILGALEGAAVVVAALTRDAEWVVLAILGAVGLAAVGIVARRVGLMLTRVDDVVGQMAAARVVLPRVELTLTRVESDLSGMRLAAARNDGVLERAVVDVANCRADLAAMLAHLERLDGRVEALEDARRPFGGRGGNG